MDPLPKISVWSDAEVWRQLWSLWVKSELYRFFGRNGPMRLVDATWTPGINMLHVRCGCGHEFQHRADRWTVRCKKCFLEANLQDVREQFRMDKEAEMAAKQQQKVGLAPSMFQKYLAPMKGAWDEGKEKAKKGGQALGTGAFFCRLVALYPKEMPIKDNGKDTGQKCLGVVAKLTVVTGPATGGSCWKVWQFVDRGTKTARENFQDFQADLVKMGMNNIDSISEADLQQTMADLAATTPGVKINRTQDRNGNVDKNGNVYVNTWIEGSVSENDLIGLGAMPKQGSAASMGGTTIEEPPEDIGEPHEPGEVQAPAPVQAPPTAQRTVAAPAAAPQPVATPARPPRSAPAAVEPVELDVGGGESEPGLDVVEPEPALDAEPPLEDDNIIAIGKTVQFLNPKTKTMAVGTVQARHSSGKGWLVRDNNNPTDKFGISDDNVNLKLVS